MLTEGAGKHGERLGKRLARRLGALGGCNPKLGAELMALIRMLPAP